MARLLRLNFSATSSLKLDTISFLKEVLLISIILRKSLWEKLYTMVDSSFQMEKVVLVVGEWISLVFLCLSLFVADGWENVNNVDIV